MATNRAGNMLMQLQKGQSQLSRIHLTLRSINPGRASTMEANIASQARLKKMEAESNPSQISMFQYQSSDRFGVGSGAAPLELKTFDLGNKLLKCSFSEVGREADGVLLARGKKPVVEDHDETEMDSDIDDDDEDVEDLFEDDDEFREEDDLDDEDIVEVKKGSRGTK